MQDIFDIYFNFTFIYIQRASVSTSLNIIPLKNLISMEIVEKADRAQANLIQQVIQWRRHLHQQPELSFQEHKTTAYIASILDELGIGYERVSPTGLIGFIQGNGLTDKSIALRADIDALPIQEENKHGYASQQDGVMHACGHDFHTSNLLGVAYLLKQQQASLPGNVVLIFQAAEERIPGGASAIMESGILDRLKVQAVVGQHVSPQMDLGTFGFKSEVFMASSDELYIDILGKGGHGAQPHLNLDPVIIAAQLLVGLQQLVSRHADPRIPSVLSFGKVIANGAANVIPDSVQLAGTFRTTDENWRAKALAQVENLVLRTVDAYGASAKIEIRRGYPSLYNNKEIIEDLQSLCASLYGAANSLTIPTWMAAEDFAYYAKKYPSAFYLVGTKNEQIGITSELHTSTFDIDEAIYEKSVEFMFKATVSLLQKL